MKSNEIRSSFIEFFSEKNHTFVKSAPVFPKEDPSLLFTNAGMNQFKNIFLGISNEANLKRAVNSQKCMRVSGKHNDLEEVGRDGTHHTFFEMLGNWSFGDYYKKEAISWAWELLTKVWKLPKNKLHATIYTTDDEAEQLWKELTDIDHSHILRLEKENFWEMGETGPCGPCSEIYIDKGEELSCGPSCNVACNCGRFMEFWNLVFIQYNRNSDGSLSELAAKHVDTGMGLERITAILQGKSSNYDTDAFTPIIESVAKMAGKKYSGGIEGMPFRVIADHIRALSIAIADGVLPSNESRGYVMRRLLRRAYRYGKKLGFTGPFLNELSTVVVDRMGGAYPELVERQDFIKKIIETEEKSFERTLDKGLSLFDEAVNLAKKSNSRIIDGATVFKLYDTYGFPYDLTAQLAEENSFSLDKNGFDSAMSAQRERARAASKFKDMTASSADWIKVSEGGSSQFTGYSSLEESSIVRQVRKSVKGYDIILDKTPFYAESGGQCGDSGIIFLGEAGSIEIFDTIKEGVEIIHCGICDSEIDFSAINEAVSRVDEKRRTDIRRNHTATHIIQYSLRRVLGDHVKQSGSMNNPDRLRFDFTHFQALTEEEIAAAERIANELVLKNLQVTTNITSIKEAESIGALALFGEKYGDSVRVVSVGTDSIELCGGTHVVNTGEIGYIHILFETSVSSGIRRIEAVTGRSFGEFFRRQQPVAKALSTTFKVPFEKTMEQVQNQAERIKSLEKDNTSLKTRIAMLNIDHLIASAISINGIKLIKEYLGECDRAVLEPKGSAIVSKTAANAIALLFAEVDGKGALLAAVSEDLVKTKKVNAGTVVKTISELAGGKGGGRPNLAQGGAKDIASLRSIYDKLEKIMEDLLK